MTRSICFTTLLAYLVLDSVSNSAVVALHEGANDPTTEGWLQLRPFSDVITSPVLNDQDSGIDAWSINDTMGGAIPPGHDGLYGVYLTPEEIDQADTNGWKLSAQLRVVETDILDAPTDTMTIAFVNNSHTYQLHFGQTSESSPIVRLWSGEDPPSTSLVLHDLDSVYHLFELVFDPVANSADLYVDSVLRSEDYTGILGADLNIGNELDERANVYFGSTGNDHAGQANYALVSFETGHPDPPSLNTELLVNGDAETGDSSGWISVDMEVAPQSFAGTDGLATGVSVGSHSFWGGAGSTGPHTLTQTIDVSGLASEIDQGLIKSAFSVLLQSRADDASIEVDRARSILSFLNTTDAAISSVEFLDTEFSNSTYDWEQFADQRIVPFGTRSIQVVLEGTRDEGDSTDALFDNASLNLSQRIAGDLNDDGFVGQGDLGIVLERWGRNVTAGEWLFGDPNGDGFVGQDDLNSVLGSWGQGTLPAVSAVPEPQSLLLAAIGIARFLPFWGRTWQRKKVGCPSFHGRVRESRSTG